MKHISRTLFALLALCLALTACTQTIPPEEEPNYTAGTPWTYTPSDDAPVNSSQRLFGRLVYHDDSIFFFAGPQLGIPAAQASPDAVPVQTLMRLDVKTGAVSTVCPDPACTHSAADCPFAGMYVNFAVDARGDIFYLRARAPETGEGTLWQYCLYDTAAGTCSVLSDDLIPAGEEDTFSTTTAGRPYVVSHGDDLYYYDCDHKPAAVGTSTTCRSLIRVNRVTGQSEIMQDHVASTATKEVLLFVLGERMILWTAEGLWSADLEMGDRRLLCEGDVPPVTASSTRNPFTDGTSIYYLFREASSKSNYVLYRMDANGENGALVISPLPRQWVITQNYLYYPEGTGLQLYKDMKNPASVYDVLVRCDLRDENLEMAHKSRQETEDSSKRYLGITNMLPVGNYLFGTYKTLCDENRNGQRDDGDVIDSAESFKEFALIRYDMTTQAADFVFPNH